MMRAVESSSRQSQQKNGMPAATSFFAGRHTVQPENRITCLQTTLGNQGMLRMMAGGILQRKLTINQPGDAYEQEADRVADAVMRMPDPAAPRQPLRQAGIRGRLQRCSCGKSASGQCEECRTQAVKLQRRSAAMSGADSVPTIVHEVLTSPGRPLDAATRSFMEPRFGHDFSKVRIHTDARAAESARAVGALAYTVGTDVVFNEEQHASEPETRRAVLAHELTHVLQNQKSSAMPMVKRKCSPPQKRVDRSENEGQKPGVDALPLAPCRWLLHGFSIGSSEFVLQFAPAVTQLADFLKHEESAKLMLIGLTDCFGDDETNRSIATARAQNVKRAFPGNLHGRIELLPSDGKMSVVSNETALKRSLNRSVQIEIVPPKGVPCPAPVPLVKQGAPTAGRCGAHEETVKTAIRLAAAFAVTALSRVRNWRQSKNTRNLIDSFYRVKDDAGRQKAADKIATDLTFMIPRLRSPFVACLSNEDKDYATVCPENTIADAGGTGAVLIPTFCLPQFVTITPSREIQAGTVIHEFSHRFPGLDDLGRTYYETNTCAETDETKALSGEQRLRHADTFSCFVVKAALESP